MHLNELQESYGGKGLSIIAVTSEGKSDTERFVKKFKAQYAYGYDQGGQLSEYFKVAGIPHAVLVDASGTVIWKGHPGNLDAPTIEKALVGALPKPLFEWPEYAAKVKSAVLERAYGKALAEAKKLSGDGSKELLETVQGLVSAQVEQAKRFKEAGDYLAAQTIATRLVKDLDKLPEQATAKQILKDIEADPKGKSIVEAQQRLAKIDVEALKKKDEGMKAKAELERMLKTVPDTLPARIAAQKLERLKAILPGLR